tara:strand:+ start:558 stop:698 length:141 start_codon:yes stop_codon:yes gene_type:complete
MFSMKQLLEMGCGGMHPVWGLHCAKTQGFPSVQSVIGPGLQLPLRQ